jgi:hypothetical protein
MLCIIYICMYIYIYIYSGVAARAPLPRGLRPHHLPGVRALFARLVHNKVNIYNDKYDIDGADLIASNGCARRRCPVAAAAAAAAMCSRSSSVSNNSIAATTSRAASLIYIYTYTFIYIQLSCSCHSKCRRACAASKCVGRSPVCRNSLL